MRDDSSYVFSAVQKIFLCAIGIAFIVLFWGMIPISGPLKVILCCIIGALAIFCAFLFANSLLYFKHISNWMALALTFAVFLTFPIAIKIIHSVKETEYRNSYPSDNQISVKITYKIKRIKSGGSIGDDWTFNHYFNDQKFVNGDVLSVDISKPFHITSQFIETDLFSDIGEVESQEYNYASNDAYKKDLIIVQNVHIDETGGKTNEGSFADFEVVYTLERVYLPMPFWKVFMFSSNKTIKPINIWPIAGQIICLIVIIAIPIIAKNKKAANEKQKRLAEEESFLSEKKAFIQSLNGQSIRQAAGVPDGVTFVNGLPKDNNDAPFGSFTVYCSHNGTCYHDRSGCCSARYPVHYFSAKNFYKPCSKCCTKEHTYPQWYVDYSSLKKQAEKYGIDVPE